MAVLGIDVGGTKVASAAFGVSGELFAKEVMLLDGREGDDVGKLIAQIINEIYKKLPNEGIEGVGICVPGIYYTKKDTVWAPNIPGWDNYPLKENLINRIDKDLLKSLENEDGYNITIGSDRTCYILGELWKGAAVGCENAIYLAVGTGVALVF